MSRDLRDAMCNSRKPSLTLRVGEILALLVWALGSMPTVRCDEPAAEQHFVTWLHSLDEASELARVRRTPILVIFGAEWCGPCKLLDKEIEHASVQKELERWVPVHLDVDVEQDAAEKMVVSAIPALRILTPDGRVIGQQEGMMDSDALAAWLSEQFTVATSETTSEKVAAKLTSTTIRKVLKDFRSRESSVREAAISRVVEFPQLAAAHVVAEFTDASLSERLAYLELLTAWEAPVDGLDPWIPTSITTERISGLSDWLKKKEFPQSDDDTELSPSEIVEADLLLRMLLTADATESAAYREQLARMGSGVLPLIREAMNDDPDDEARVRLSMARYRVAASNELVMQWPGGIELLATPEFSRRVAAVHELSTRVTSQDESLLSELVADPAPLIREISLGALKRIGGGRADGPLVKMLADPDPNVRAAVLKHLAEAGTASLVPAITDYINREQDVDLVVHAVRCMRQIPDVKAAAALLPLLDHASWRVRAEAVEGIHKYLTDSSRSSQAISPSSSAVADPASLLFLKRLDDEDGFVVGKVIEGLTHISAGGEAEQTELLSALDRAVGRHPALALVIFRAASARSWSAFDYNTSLRNYCKHDAPMIRAAAISRLVENLHDTAFPEVQTQLDDEDMSVRVAALNAVGKEVRRQILETVKTQIQELASHPRLGTDKLEEAAPTLAEEATPAIEVMPDEVTTPTHREGSLLSALGNFFSGNSDNDFDSVMIESSSSVAGSIAKPGASHYTAEDSDAVFQKILGDRTLPESIYQFEEPLQRFLRLGERDETLAAAKCLAILGNTEALAAVMQAAADRAHMESIAELLPALPWAPRQELFHLLLNAASSAEDRAAVTMQLADNCDPRSTLEIWALLSADEITLKETALQFEPLRYSYPTGREYAVTQVDSFTKEAMLRDSRNMTTAGTRWQLIAGLMMLSWCQDPAVADAAAPLVGDTALPAELRATALQFQLASLSVADAQRQAMTLLADPEIRLAETALRFLSLGASGIQTIGDEFHIQTSQIIARSYSGSEPEPVILTTPDGMTVDQVTPFLQSSRTEVAVCAAHLLALLKDTQGLQLLIDHWRGAHDNDAGAQKMLYQALTVANDPQHMPLLEEMYFRMSKAQYSSNMSDFYWTIRTMTGPEIIALRKKIRDEQGADKLR